MDKKNFRLAPWTGQQHQNTKTGRETKKKWEDDLNEFLKTEETQERTKYDLMNNNIWMMEAKIQRMERKGRKVYEDLVALKSTARRRFRYEPLFKSSLFHLFVSCFW